MTDFISERKTCRCCGSDKLLPLLNLGNQYIINFPEEGSKDLGLRAPLEMVLCGNPACSLAQLRHTVDRDIMYREYWYKSGINQTMRDALADVTREARASVKLGSGDIVIDIGANDGTLLRSYGVDSLRTVGFEPASNLVAEASAGGATIINDYFNAAAFEQAFPGRKAKVITSIAMFYDLEDPNAFVGGIARILDKDGIWINQMNYLGTMLEGNAFDNISHEHLEYYSLSSLQHLLGRHGLEVFDVSQNDLNGGSMRALIAARGARPVTGNVSALTKAESGLATPAPYQAFVARIDAIRSRLRSFIESERSKGRTVYVYGASTRGNTLLQYFDLDQRMLVAAAERNPAKWGRKTVGTNVPIISEDQARAAKPDYFLVLPWSFIGEFVKREQAFLEGGGKFIVPLPDFRVISQADAAA